MSQEQLLSEFEQSSERRAVFSPYVGTVAKINEHRFIVQTMSGEVSEHTFDEVANWEFGSIPSCLQPEDEQRPSQE